MVEKTAGRLFSRQRCKTYAARDMPKRGEASRWSTQKAAQQQRSA